MLRPAPDPSVIRYDSRKILSLLVIPFYLALVAILWALPREVSLTDPVVLLLLNAAFLGVIPLYVAYISFASFRRGGAVSTLFMGAGMLVIGLAGIAAGLIGFLPNPANPAVTVFNICVCIGAVLQLAGALTALIGWREPGERRLAIAAAAYAVAAALTAGIVAAALLALTPAFFVPGTGSTGIRDLVLAGAVECLLLAAVVFLVLHRKRGEDFFFWYAVGLAMLGLGLIAVAIIPVFGGALNWAARAGQYIGACYILVAFLVLERRATAERVPARELLASFFADAEAGYRQLVETAGDAIVVLDPDGRVLLWNTAAERMFGYAADEAGGMSFAALALSAGDAPLMLAASASDSSAAVHRETEARRKDGSSFPIELTASRRLVEGQAITTCIVHDLSKRRRNEEARARSEARQALLAEVASRLLSAEEPQALIDELGRRALGVLGCDVFFNYLADEASGRLRLNAYAGIPAEEAERIRLLDYGAVVCGCVARDGCRIVAEAIRDNPDPRTDLVAGYGVRAYACHPLVVGGRTIGTLSFGTVSRDRFSADDLATMKAIADLIAVALQRIVDRDALRKSEERLRLAQESARVGVWDWDLRTGRQTYTPELVQLYGVDPEAMRDYAAWRKYIHPDDIARVEAERDEAIARGESFDSEFRVIDPSGEVRWLATIGRGYCDESGELARVIGVNIDITARKEAELALARNAEELARSNEELQRFAYVASHDLQEPLRSIVSFSQLLERRYKGALDQDADDYLSFIVEGGNRMQRLIQDLLQFSRLETQARDPVPTDAGRVIRDALALFNGTIREASGTVTVGPMPTVRADPAQLEQVFANLIGNALKYRRDGVPPELGISARRNGLMVEFAVADNGIGIEEQYYDRIFEMFRRLHTHDRYEGTGIGLAVVKRIVERHGGRIRVESTPGEGSTFFFTIPAA